MPRKNYAAMMMAINKKLSQQDEEHKEKPVYRVRILFRDTTSLQEVVRKEAEAQE